MSKAPTILVVDDEEIIRNILVKLLCALGYSVLQASDSSRAISMIRQHRPDLLLLDIVMPGMDSMAVLKTVRGDADLQDTPIVLISAIDDLDVVAAYIEAGADDFLPKPFNSTLLQLKIRNALECKNSRLQLQAAQQSRESFCSQLAHDLNNNLTGTLMSAELLLMESLSDASRKYIEDIITSTEQISKLIKQRREGLKPGYSE